MDSNFLYDQFIWLNTLGQPSISILQSIDDVKAALSQAEHAAILGFFGAEDLVLQDNLEEGGGEGQGTEDWQNFYSAADGLRGYVDSSFCVICSLLTLVFLLIIW